MPKIYLIFLGDGSYQVLSSTEFSAMGLSYEGVVFSDGETQVVYYNQLDERWKNLPYGTDNIGGYACGPTAMSIVVSSLTSDTVDPPHMHSGPTKMATGAASPAHITHSYPVLPLHGIFHVRDARHQSRKGLWTL